MGKTELKNEQVLKNGVYLMELIRAALMDIQAPEKPEELSWRQIYHLAEIHKVGGLTAFALSKLKKKPSEELYQKWSTLPQLITRRVLLFDIERENIFAKMKEAGLSYLPLKGVHIIHYYPKAGMRTMADNDILFGFVEPDEHGIYHIKGDTKEEQERTAEAARKKMNAVMTEMGYQSEGLGDVHDSYIKNPVYHYEMHKKLVREDSIHRDYYVNPWAKAVPGEQDNHFFYFPDEDEYLFFMAHAYKHFTGGGFGIRFLADTYVFWQKKPSMNRQYLDKELEKMQMLGFEHAIVALVRKIFTPGKLTYTDEELELLCYMIENGAYGTVSTRVMNRIGAMAGENQKAGLRVRMKYIWKRVSPGEEFWKEHFPVAYKYPILRPFYRVRSIIKGLIMYPDRLFTEWKAIWKKSK